VEEDFHPLNFTDNCQLFKTGLNNLENPGQGCSKYTLQDYSWGRKNDLVDRL
jgi:hypothetical protein